MRENWCHLSFVGAFDYEVSDRGRVRHGDRILTPDRNDEGYLRVRLRVPTALWVEADKLTAASKASKSKAFFIHRLVLMAFRGWPSKGQQGLHRNGKRDDNRLSNLDWGTHQDNHRDKVRAGTAANHAGKRLSAAHVSTIRVSKVASRKLAKKLGLAFSTVRDIRSGRRHK